MLGVDKYLAAGFTGGFVVSLAITMAGFACRDNLYFQC
jgi:hypothetical protein